MSHCLDTASLKVGLTAELVFRYSLSYSILSSNGSSSNSSVNILFLLLEKSLAGTEIHYNFAPYWCIWPIAFQSSSWSQAKPIWHRLLTLVGTGVQEYVKGRLHFRNSGIFSAFFFTFICFPHQFSEPFAESQQSYAGPCCSPCRKTSTQIAAS